MKKQSRLVLQILVIVLCLGVGFWLRILQTTRSATGERGWRPWRTSTTVTLYFSDGDYLFPVSHRMPNNTELPRAALEALLQGPAAGSGLKNLIPSGVQIRSVRVDGATARVDISGVGPQSAQGIETAIVETLTALRGITSVKISIDGKTPGAPARRTPLLYFASANGLVAVPIMVTSVREALQIYLSGPPASKLTGLPADVQLLSDEYNSSHGLLFLKFSYTPSLRALAIDRPDRMRTVLLGLIASLTEFSDVQAVQLDFGGQTRLGLGQCSDLLRTPQPRPALLNDERLVTAE